MHLDYERNLLKRMRLPNPANTNNPAYNSTEKIFDDLRKSAFANDSHSNTLKMLLANAPTYNMLLLSVITALAENPKNINTADDNAKKMRFPVGSTCKNRDKNADMAIPLEME